MLAPSLLVEACHPSHVKILHKSYVAQRSLELPLSLFQLRFLVPVAETHALSFSDSNTKKRYLTATPVLAKWRQTPQR